MTERRIETVQDVVAAHLCTQCGTCAAACPAGSISIRENAGGMLVPTVLSDGCDLCGACVDVCPGIGISPRLPEGVDPLEGTIRKVYIGHAVDESTRAKGQSGGVGAALAIHLLTDRLVDAVLVTTAPEDGSLRPSVMLASTLDEVIAAQGSKYSSAGGNALLGSPEAKGQRIAAFSLPCQTQGIEKVQREGLAVAATVSYRIGLFCDRALLRTCTDQMLRDAGLDRAQVALVRYRSKARSGWPGEVQVVMKSGEERFFPSSLRTSLKEIFTVPRCRLCFDKANIFADVVLGDPWGVSDDERGDSVILVRTQRGEELLQGACGRGLIEMMEIPAELVFKHQRLDERRRSVERYCQLWTEMGRVRPIYDGLSEADASQSRPSVRRFSRRLLRLNCRLAERTNPEDVARVVRMYRLSKAVRSRPARLLEFLRLSRSAGQPANRQAQVSADSSPGSPGAPT